MVRYDLKIKDYYGNYERQAGTLYRDKSHTQLAGEYYAQVYGLLKSQVNDLLINEKLRAVYPSEEDYFAYYDQYLKKYIDNLANDIAMDIGPNYSLCAAEFTVYEIYRLDKIYNHREFDYREFTGGDYLDTDIAYTRMIYNPYLDDLSQLPMEYRSLLGEKRINQDKVIVRFGPGEEFEVADQYHRGQLVEVFGIAYADGEIWVNTAPQEYFFIKASAVK